MLAIFKPILIDSSYTALHCSKKLKEHKYDTAAKNNHYKDNEFFILFSTDIVSTHV